MAIKEEVTLSYFMDRFNEVRPKNFSYEGLEALYNYLEQLSEDTGEDIELDVIAICCDYTEYDSLEEVLNDYNLETRQDLEDRTIVIDIPDSKALIVGQF
tara:strand:+ start:215 stop:514 length:300 start_codon:yes stop_codon:yes gene_type:complete